MTTGGGALRHGAETVAFRERRSFDRRWVELPVPPERIYAAASVALLLASEGSTVAVALPGLRRPVSEREAVGLLHSRRLDLDH